MNSIDVSIVVPVYNVEKELSRCINRLQNQTISNIEILLIDDGSTDASPQICDYYQNIDNRVKVFHKKNGGLSEARNTGLQNAKGVYLLYVDSDDYIEIDSCEKLLQCMDEDVDFVVGVIKEINGKKVKYQKRHRLQSGNKYTSKNFIINSIKANEWYAPAVLNLYRRSFLINNNLFFKVGYFFEDHEILPRLYLSAKKIAYLDYPFYNYIVRKGSIMTSENSQKKTDISLIIWNEWFQLLQNVKDEELQMYMFGILIRYYLKNCRVRKIKGWKIKNMNFKFCYKYALGIKERIKVVLHALTSLK